MTGFDILAVIGAVTGVLALGWQIYSQIRTWRMSGPQISVKVSNGFPVYDDRAGEHHFFVKAVNRGGSAATVDAWGIRFPDGRDLVPMRQLPFSTQLPAVIAPHANATFNIPGEAVLDECRRQGVKARQLKAWVRLATGDEVFGGTLPWKD
jgi:hypothetical protein